MAGVKSKIKIAAAAIAVLFFVFILTAVALPFLINADQFRPQIESALSNRLERAVRLGELRLSLFSGRLSVDNITIMDNPEFSPNPFVTASSLYIGVELRPLIFSKKVHITEISLERPSISLLRTTEGKWNFSDLGAVKTDAAEPSVKEMALASGIKVGRLKITNGRVEIIEPRKKTATYEKVTFFAENLSHDTASPFKLSAAIEGNGLLALGGPLGPLSREDALLTPFDAVLEITHFDPAVSGFIPAGADLSGLFDFKGELNSSEGVAKSKGKASIANLRLV
ncbi:MAG: AsmA family protein, partial [Acidobacteriota bacterium]|nr:AsmA family protein [Acidobacteriota bacterium]